MKDKIPVKEMPQTERMSKCEQLARLDIFSIAYNWANYKQNLDEAMINKHTHKAFLRKNHLGKFAKGK